MQTQYEISVPKYFSWQAILGYLSRNPTEVMYQVVGDKVRRAFEYHQQKYLIEIAYQNSRLIISILNQVTDSTPITRNILPFIRDWFDLDTDLTDFYVVAGHDDILHSLVDKFAGLRLVGMPDFYEAITWGILGQEINLGYTYTLKRRFTERFGESLTYQGQHYWIYPQPDVVAQSSPDELLQLGLTHRKVEYLLGVSAKIAKHEISKDDYQKYANAGQAEKAMTKLRGIGPWTANYVLMRCLRMGDAFPMADIGLLNGIKKIQGLSGKPDRQYLLKLKSRWGRWASYATFYIWRELY